MALTIEIIPDPERGGFTARLPDITAYGEGETEDEAIDDLKEAIRGYIETFGLDDAERVIDLHPAGFTSSQANAVSGNSQGGWAAGQNGLGHAILWHGAVQRRHRTCPRCAASFACRRATVLSGRRR